MLWLGSPTPRRRPWWLESSLTSEQAAKAELQQQVSALSKDQAAKEEQQLTEMQALQQQLSSFPEQKVAAASEFEAKLRVVANCKP